MILSLIYGILILILTIIFLVNSIRYRKKINIYVKYGVLFAIILLAFEIAVVALIPNFFEVTPWYQLLIADAIVFVRTLVFTCMGIYYCSMLGIVEIPLIKKFSGKTDDFETFTSRNYILTIIGTAIGAILFSVILFKLTSPHISDAMKQLSESQGAKLGISDEPSVLLALVVLAFAFSEEIVFRLGIQNYLAKQFRLNGDKYWVAVVLTSGLWALAHVNMLAPEWVKIAQIFPIGIAFGFLFKKYGLESCILAHGILNLGMMGLGPYLIQM